MSYRNSSNQRDPSKDRTTPNNLVKTKLSQTVYSAVSSKTISNTTSNPPVRRDSIKNNPPPLPPKTKLKQEDLMTQSRIVQAKNGLQLLKKKMSQKGMLSTKSSTQKEEIAEEEEVENVGNGRYGKTPPKAKLLASQKEIGGKQEQQQYDNKKRNSGIVKAETHQQEQQKIEYVDPSDDRPIKSKNIDFEKMLEQELRKEQLHQSVNTKVSAIKQKGNELPSEYAPEQKLHECRAGCGRTFKKQALEKHEKNCQKVFMQQRKTFDSAQQRHLEVEDKPVFKGKPPSKVKNQAPPPKVVESKHQSKELPKQSMPKWKLQSLQLRSGLKRAGQKELTKEEAQFENLQKDTLVQCGTCGRRFNDQAAQRHIPFCQQQAKKIATKPNPLASTKKKW